MEQSVEEIQWRAGEPERITGPSFWHQFQTDTLIAQCSSRSKPRHRSKYKECLHSHNAPTQHVLTQRSTR